MDNKKYNFKVQSHSVVPRIKFNEKVGDYVKYGENNRFPQELIKYSYGSSIHSTCIRSIVENIIGNGLVCNIDDILTRTNSDGDTLNDIFLKISDDYYLYGGYSLEIIWNNAKDKISLYHIPFQYLRAKEKDFRGKIPGYFLSANWDKLGFFNKDKDIPYLPTFNPETKQSNSIFVKKKYKPGQEYYPLPEYIAALRILELDMQIDDFHVNNMKNGLKPSVSITTFTGGNDEQVKEVEKQINDNYAGAENAGAVIYMDVEDPAKAPIINPIQQNGNDKYYIEINSMSTQKILTAHRITSPMLVGIKDNVGLGNNADEIKTAQDLFLTTVIAPLQSQILAGLEFVLNSENEEIILGVENINIFPSIDEKESKVNTSDNSDLGEDSQLENKIDTLDKINTTVENNG